MIKAQMNVNRPLTGFLAIFDDAVCFSVQKSFPLIFSVFGSSSIWPCFFFHPSQIQVSPLLFGPNCFVFTAIITLTGTKIII